MSCGWCNQPLARGRCPWSVTCPECGAKPGRPCKRPSGHRCEMHAARYRETERRDGAECPGFVPYKHSSCALCSGREEDHAVMGKVEHSYPPSHPWYYFKGGVPLGFDDIAPAKNGGSYNQLVPRKARATRKEQIEAAIRGTRAELRRLEARYRDLVDLGDAAIAEFERSYDRPGKCKALHVALSLVHNHVSYNKGVLARLYEFLGVPFGTPVPGESRPVQMF